MTSLARTAHLGSPGVRLFCGHSKQAQRLWDRVVRLGSVARLVTVPGTLVGIASFATGYRHWQPEHYAQWYLRWVAAGRFVEPLYEGLWVDNSALIDIVEGVLTDTKRTEGTTLISGLQMSGKTSGVLMVCSKAKRWGFYVSFGSYKKDSDGDLNTYFTKNLLANERVGHNLLQNFIWCFLPAPDLAHINRGLFRAFRNGGLVLVIDETQKLANKDCLADGIMNDFCELSAYGPVILLASEYSVPLHLKKMTHVDLRTSKVYAPTATNEQMLPHLRERFGEEAAEKIASTFGGAFGILQFMRKAPDMDAQIASAIASHKSEIELALGLNKNGMKSLERADRTALAMCAAVELAFGTEPVNPFDEGTLELAQARAVCLVGSSRARTVKATWTSPVTENIMKELLCDSRIRTTMNEYFKEEDIKKFEAAIHGKCVVNSRWWQGFRVGL